MDTLSKSIGMILVLLAVCFFGPMAQAKYSGGTGEPNDPYQIATAEDLMLLGETPEDYDRYFVLTTDIDLDPNLPGRKVFDKAVIAPDTNPVDWPERDTFDGTLFRGSFDGNDHTISHLTIEGGSYLGLFGSLAHGGEIRDLAVENVNLVSSGYGIVGGLVGYNQGNLTHCHSSGGLNRGNEVGGLVGRNGGRIMRCDANVTVSGFTYVGGLVGVNSFLHQDTGDFGYIAHSFSTAAVSSNGDRVGGLVGDNGGDVVQCYSAGSVDGRYDVGGLIGLNQLGSGFITQNKVTQCYSTGAVSGRGSSTGGLIGGIGPFGSAFVTMSFWDVQTSGQTESAGGTGKTTVEMQDPNTYAAVGWDFFGESDGPNDIWALPPDGGYPILWWQVPASQLPALPYFSGGTGEPNAPYLIATPYDLQRIGQNPRLMAAHFSCLNDINLGGVSYVPIGGADLPFTGIFDGNGKRILNFTYTSENQSGIAFFGRVSGRAAVIKDVQLVAPNVDAGIGSDVGLLVGVLVDGEIRGCSVQNGFLSAYHAVGALVGGLSDGRVRNCYSTSCVLGMNFVGGLIGQANSSIVTHCYSAGPVMGSQPGGLLGGNNFTTINACFWDTETSGLVGSYGGTGKTTAEMQMAETFLEAGWDFVGETLNGPNDIWKMWDGYDYPRLAWETGPNTPLVFVDINDPSFYGQMSKYEVTNTQYCDFLNAALASGDITIESALNPRWHGYYVIGASGSNPGTDYAGERYYNGDGSGWSGFDGVTNGGAARIYYSAGAFYVDSGFGNHPVTEVSWYGATAFADYYGYYLPTEEQWQGVADYDGTYLYGCGTSIDHSKANYSGSAHPFGTTAVGSFGQYGYGVSDMAGNVREWTSTSSGDARVIRDGCWFFSYFNCTVSVRWDTCSPFWTDGHIGFRVCR